MARVVTSNRCFRAKIRRWNVTYGVEVAAVTLEEQELVVVELNFFLLFIYFDFRHTPSFNSRTIHHGYKMTKRDHNVA